MLDRGDELFMMRIARLCKTKIMFKTAYPDNIVI